MEIMIRKSQPTPSDVHVNEPLTNISIAYMQRAENFVADRVFPNIPVDKQSDLYFTFDRGYFNRSEMKVRAPATESAGADYAVSNDNYFAQVYALHHDIPDQRRANTDNPLQPDREATELLSHQALIHREKSWAAAYFAAGVWTNDPTPATLWDAASGSDPLGDIETGIQTIGESTGYEPNMGVQGRAVWGVLKNHADIVDRIKYGQTAPGAAKVSLQALAQLVEIDQILVSRAIENTAAEGATNSHSYIAGKHFLLCYSEPSPGLMKPSGGYTFSWSGYSGAGPAGQRISRERVPLKKADRVEIEQSYVHKLVSADMGYLLESVIS